MTLSSFLNALNPMTVSAPFSPFLGIALWIMMLMYALLILLQKESSLMLNLFMAVAIVCGIINELGLPRAGSTGLNLGSGLFHDILTLNPPNFASYFTAVLMFVLPLVVVGMTKTPRSRFPGILGVIMALLFIFWSWLTVWRAQG
jgi:hypothetical protein